MPPTTPALIEPELPIREVILGLVGLYNRSLYPAAVFGVLLMLVAVAVVLIKPGRLADLFAKVLLDLAWLWVGVMFFFERVGPEFRVGYAFAALFVLQGTFFMVDFFFGTLEFRPYENRGRLFGGLALILVAGVAHPLVAIAAGRGWPYLMLAGTGPAATAAVTLGVLLFTLHKPRPVFFLIPAAWAGVAGVRLAEAWGFHEELIPAAVALAAVLWFAVVTWRDRRSHSPAGGEISSAQGAK